jgi:hypothetical protein
MLLPPKVQGPINQVATSVTVLGSLDGAVVQLFVNGAAAGIPTTASGLSVAVGLGATVLTPGQQVTATQSLAGDTSIPSPFPETVAAGRKGRRFPIPEGKDEASVSGASGERTGAQGPFRFSGRRGRRFDHFQMARPRGFEPLAT